MFSTVGGFAGGESGGFMNLLGPGGMGLTGSTSEGSAQVTLDPTTQALNNLRLQGLQGLQSGNNPFYQTSGTTNDLINQLIGQASIPGVQTPDWYNQAINGTGIGTEQSRLNDFKDQG